MITKYSLGRGRKVITGTVCEIEKYAIHDGPGIRTVVFLKGCPLSCLWCSNPETQSINQEVYFNTNKCMSCGRCVQVCTQNAIDVREGKAIHIREKCIGCGKCADTCAFVAFNTIGRKMTVTEVFEELIKDDVFYQKSGGGITISGGEVLMHGDFVEALLKMCKENYLHTAIETSGFGSFDTLKRISKYTDLIMFDIKHMDNEVHKKLTGVSNKIIHSNLRKLSQDYGSIIIRIPLIPGLNDHIRNIEETTKLALELKINEIHLLPYHSLGLEKYKQLGLNYTLGEVAKPNVEEVDKLKEAIESNRVKCIIGG